MKMLVIFGILVMFTEAGMGLLFMNPDCRFTQSDPCYGAVGRPLYLQLPSEDELDLKKNNSGTASGYIFRFKKQKITQNHSDYPRWQFVTNNSTMMISSAEKRDSGRYILHTFASTGTSKGVYHLQLIIEAAVSSVTLTDSCLSIEKRKFYCSSDGENVHYSWTFPHTHQLADGNQTLLLDREAVTCYAQNHVSSGQKAIELQQCPDPTTVTPTTTPKSKMTPWMQSGKGKSLTVTDKEAQTPTHNCTSNPQVPLSFQRDIVFVSVQVLEIIILLSLLGGFHIYARIQRKQTNRAAETVVSSGPVKDSCFSSKKRKLHCSSDGDDLQFSWFFSGITLRHQLADGDRTLILDKDKVGNVICYVQN